MTPNQNFLVWSDEFDGTVLDATKWNVVVGKHLNGDGQLQTTTADNVSLDGQGHLVIKALSTPTGYTSGYINTFGKFSRQYGVFTSRIKCAPGNGLWSSFWMVGVNGGWPGRGEIDIVEQIGTKEPNTAHATIHGVGFSDDGVSKAFVAPNADGDWHDYSVEWRKQLLTFSLDGNPVFVVSPSSIPQGATWPFDAQACFLRFSLAVGGTWPGPPDAESCPSEMLVDWVRVYE